MEADLERTEIHRLFYVEHDHSSNDEISKIAGDLQNISKVVMALHQLNLTTAQVFCVFGHKVALEEFLHTLFPNSHTSINSVFTNLDMPIVWTIHNSKNFVFSLISNDDVSSEKANYFTIVMQRFLRDMCRNIIICPSKTFFVNFSTEHSFHGKPHETRTYRQVKTELFDIQPPRKVNLDDKNSLKVRVNDQCRNVLITNNSANTYCVQKINEEPNHSTTNNKFNKLKESLETRIDFDKLSVRDILNLCKDSGIFLSKIQESQIQNNVENHTKAIEKEKVDAIKQAALLIDELLGRENKSGNFSQTVIEVDKKVKKQLDKTTAEWLIDPNLTDEKAEHLFSRLVVIIYSDTSHKKYKTAIGTSRIETFTNELQRIDKKGKIRQLQEHFIQFIGIVAQSENQFDVHFDIHRLHYTPSIDVEQQLHYLTVTCFPPIQFSLNDLGRFINIQDLSESDRREFSRRVECVACFKTYDAKNEIIVIKKPGILQKKLDPIFAHTILLCKNGVFTRIADFCLSQIYIAFSSKQNSQVLVLYNIDTGKVTRCSLNEFGHLCQNTPLELQDRSIKPSGVKSLALTVAQDLLILIDSNSTVYSINIAHENTAFISLLSRTTNDKNERQNFRANNGELYQAVQTIGEKNSIFFFQAKSCIDIMDQNYCQIHSIELNQKSQPYKMQVFTDFIDTYCVLFNAQANEVYCVQNLISDTRIERQESSHNLDKSAKQYIGNQLLDIIKRGEIQFGTPDSLDETEYHLMLSSEYETFHDRIRKYFRDLDLSAQLKLSNQKPNLTDSSLNIEQLSKILISRVPLQLCTIDMGTLVPLNNGRRDRMDHLSSESFQIGMKAREISFSYLEYLFHEIGENENLRIVGIVGRQSTGKSYLLNKIFQTRFAVAAGRCTDGIWMSYTFMENIHFIVLDCEGLFSDQRTEDEEIKLIAFLAAVCDITILSQDLGFSRFQDRLFSVLSQGVDKIAKNDKLFKGILLVAVRDISDSNSDESFEAAEQKFRDLQRRGQSGFLDRLFFNIFKIQLLHHFENKNFDHEIRKLRQLCINHTITDPVTGAQLPRRWENGKDLADRLKILLVQLYTDDFIDSNDIHTDMKISELDEEMKKAWTTFSLSNGENLESTEQQIEVTFEEKCYPLIFNHTNLQLDDNAMDNNFESIRNFLLDQVNLLTDFSSKTKEEENKRLIFVNQLIPDVMSYRRQQVIELMLNSLKNKFPSENDVIKERKTKFMNSIEQYMLSFKLQVCLKKCTTCDLKCVRNAQHTEEAKASLEKKKDELVRLQVSLKTKISKNTDDHIKELNNEIIKVSIKENQLKTQKAKLSDQLKYLMEKEKLQTDINECDSKMDAEKVQIENVTTAKNEVENQLANLMLKEEDLQDKDKLLLNLNNEMQQLLNAEGYKKDDLKRLIEEFHQNYETHLQPTNELIYFDFDQEQTEPSELQFETSSLSQMIVTNMTNIDKYSAFIQQCSVKIDEQLNTEQQHSVTTENRINEIQQQITSIEKQKEDMTITVQTQKEELANAIAQLSEINHEIETLSKKTDEQNKINDAIASSEIQKIQLYIQELQSKLHHNQNSPTNTLSLEQRKTQEDRKLQFFLSEKTKKESAITTWKKEIESSNDDIRIKELEEQVTKNEQTMIKLLESIDTVQKMIKSIEEEEENTKHQLTEELNEAKQLLENLQLYEKQILSAENQLSKTNKRKQMKENNIAEMKDNELDGIAEEEKQLMVLNEIIEKTQIELDGIKQKKSFLFTNNILLSKILNDTQSLADQQKKEAQNRLNELSELSKCLNENIKQIETSLSSNQNRFADQEQEILNLNKTFNEQKAEQESYTKFLQTNKKLNKIRVELLSLLTATKELLVTTLERLKKIYQAKDLIHKHTLLSVAFISSTDEFTRLSTIKEQLTEQLHVTNDNSPPCHYSNTQECQEQHDKITEEYNNAESHTKDLQQELSELDIYSDLKNEITRLEKEAQKYCSCETDHKCSGICQICATQDKTKQNPCMFFAGHYGEHKCDAGHVCTKFCQICKIYSLPNNRCHFSYGHKEPEHHQCERAHQCPATCVCSDPCAIPLELKQHEVHQCNKKDCWKPCMFSCGTVCAVQDHNHDAHAEMVTLTIGRETSSVKKHLCNQPHYCKGICDAPGVCKQEYKPQERTWVTESGQEFKYEHIEVEEVRDKCGIKISAGKSSHDDTKNHRCDGQHTCQERCPDCGSFCKNPQGHEGYHKALHRNKDDLHVFTSINPTDQIEIRTNEPEENTVRKYKVGESAKPENCTASCKRRGRSHFHLVECPGDSKCWEKILVDKAKHSNDTYYYGPYNPSAKKYDQILCSVYWSQKNWFPSVNNDADRKVIDSCNTYCINHAERDRNGLIVKDSSKGFCTLEAWHTENHVFDCQAEHHTLEMYQGIDICFVIDSTGSMEPYFEKVKTTITRLITDNRTLLTKIKTKCDFQFAVVDYRDHVPEGDYVFHQHNFTNHTRALAYVTGLKSGSGGDLPEAVLDGLDAACELGWRDNADHLLFHILDAPPHGKIYHTSTIDKWPDGCPCGKTAQNVLQKMKKKKIAYHVLHCSNYVNMMVAEFKKYIDVNSLTFDDKITFDGVIAKQVHQQLVDTEMTLKKA